MAPHKPLSLKARAIGLLAQREHSRTELRRKLLRIEQQRARLAAERVAGRGEGNAGSGGELASENTDTDTDIEASEPGAVTVEALLDTLAADGYLDETRFIESRMHFRASRFGAKRIQQELAQHGLKLDAEQKAVLRETELDRAREVWLRRFGIEPPCTVEERARQTRFLLARGFAPEVVHRLLRA
ncbi:RecX family transcriptional regulator [Roseateles sp.]|uniref:RecX family transcriptional regulator n=1 Tax=Roseateles sp. TaxID=1971397 RepID=UPI00326355F1